MENKTKKAVVITIEIIGLISSIITIITFLKMEKIGTFIVNHWVLILSFLTFIACSVILIRAMWQDYQDQQDKKLKDYKDQQKKREEQNFNMINELSNALLKIKTHGVDVWKAGDGKHFDEEKAKFEKDV